MNLFHERGTEHPTSPWNRINWHAVTEMVRRMQTRIVKALEPTGAGTGQVIDLASAGLSRMR
ncbi:MAG: hypothetical protein GY801_17710 [bacterium]|nr:hypothetical protein [bacterium]